MADEQFREKVSVLGNEVRDLLVDSKDVWDLASVIYCDGFDDLRYKEQLFSRDELIGVRHDFEGAANFLYQAAERVPDLSDEPPTEDRMSVDEWRELANDPGVSTDREILRELQSLRYYLVNYRDLLEALHKSVPSKQIAPDICVFLAKLNLSELQDSYRSLLALATKDELVSLKEQNAKHGNECAKLIDECMSKK